MSKNSKLHAVRKLKVCVGLIQGTKDTLSHIERHISEDDKIVWNDAFIEELGKLEKELEAVNMKVQKLINL